MLSGQHPATGNEEKKNEKAQPSMAARLFNYVKSSVGLSSNSKPICTGDVCYRPPATVSNPQNVFVETTHSSPSTFTNSTSDQEFCSASPVHEDATWHKDPNVLSFLLAVPEEFITESAKKFKCKEEKVYVANQIMRAFAMQQLADVSVEKTLLVPSANFLLTRILTCKFKANTSAQLSSVIIFFGMTAYFGPLALAKGFAVGISGSLFAKGCLFAVKKLASKVEEGCQYYSSLSLG